MTRLIDELMDKNAATKYERFGFHGPDAVLQYYRAVVDEYSKTFALEYHPVAHGFAEVNADGDLEVMHLSDIIVDMRVRMPNFEPDNAIIHSLLRRQIEVARRERVAALRARIPLAGTPAPGDVLERFLSFYLQATPTPLQVAVFRHFFWLIKRQIHKRRVIHEMMPVFSGKQGWGKTKSMEAIWEAIPELRGFVSRGRTMRIFTDPFGKGTFGRCFIMPFEEMAGSDGLPVAELKARITDPEIEMRIPHTDTDKIFPRTATFYGTTNKSLSEEIYDETGMRRFFEYKTPDVEFDHKVHKPQLEAIPLADIWACVDAESDDPPILPYLAEMRQEQAKQSTAGLSVAKFCEENLEFTGNEKHDNCILRDLYTEYLAWCGDEKIKKHDSKETLRKHIENRLTGLPKDVAIDVKHSSKRRYRGLRRKN